MYFILFINFFTTVNPPQSITFIQTSSKNWNQSLRIWLKIFLKCWSLLNEIKAIPKLYMIYMESICFGIWERIKARTGTFCWFHWNDIQCWCYTRTSSWYSYKDPILIMCGTHWNIVVLNKIVRIWFGMKILIDIWSEFQTNLLFKKKKHEKVARSIDMNPFDLCSDTIWLFVNKFLVSFFYF